MDIKLGKTALPAAILLTLLTACNQKPETAAVTPEPAAKSAAPATKPMSMRATDVRITTGAQQNKSCNIERANGTLFWPDQPRVSKANTVEISGWIVDEASQSIPDQVKLRLQTADGRAAWEQEIVKRVDRQDVANNLGVDAYAKAGFTVSLDIAELPAGDYVIYLAFDDPAGEAICGIGRRLTIAP